jgi:hypothetical protein
VLLTDRVPERQAPPTDLARELGLLDGTMIVDPTVPALYQEDRCPASSS